MGLLTSSFVLGGAFLYTMTVLMGGFFQGWISEMGIDGPTFVPKSGYFFTNLGQGLSSKVGCFLIFKPILGAGFFDKMLVLSMYLCPCNNCFFRLFWLFYFHNFVQILFEKSCFN